MRPFVFLFVGLLLPFFLGGTRNPTDFASPKAPVNETPPQSDSSQAIASAAQQPPKSSSVIRSNVNEVIVPVVVRDARGRAVPNLSKSDFQLFDNRKPQTITGFTVVNRTAETIAATSSAPSSELTNSTGTPQPASSPQRFIVFLFDDLNLSFDDLPYAKQSAMKAMVSSLAPTDFASVLSTSGTNSGMTRDHEKLRQAILDLKVNTLLRTDEHDCVKLDYYIADRIVNDSDDQALQSVVIQFAHCVRNITPEAAEAFARTTAERAVRLGEQNYRANLYSLRLILNNLMARLPGDHVIILVSPGFFAPGTDAAAIKSEVLNLAARTNTVISALDTRGLYTTNTGAEVATRVDQSSQRLIDRYHRQSMDSNADVLSELADGSGGTFIHNNNDLEARLKTLISGAEYRYLLAFSPSNMKPRVHHTLQIKVDQPNLTVQARRGYSISPPEKHSPQNP